MPRGEVVRNDVTFPEGRNLEEMAQIVAARTAGGPFRAAQELAERAMEEFHRLCGRRYQRVEGYRTDDADYLILGQGSVVPSAQAVAQAIRARLKVPAIFDGRNVYNPEQRFVPYHFLYTTRPDGQRLADVRPMARINISVILEEGGRREQGGTGQGGRHGLAQLMSAETWKPRIE